MKRFVHDSNLLFFNALKPIYSNRKVILKFLYMQVSELKNTLNENHRTLAVFLLNEDQH